jgi:hypothetical protein
MMIESRREARRSAAVVGVLLLMGTVVWAFSQETIDAVGSAVAIGAAIDKGEITPAVASQIVKLFRAERLDNSTIRRIFEAMLDTSVPLVPGDENETEVGKAANQGMGAFVLDAHWRGLRGRALADAIHAEQARRVQPGQAANDAESGQSGRTLAKTGVADNRGGKPVTALSTGNRGQSQNRNRGNR